MDNEFPMEWDELHIDRNHESTPHAFMAKTNQMVRVGRYFRYVLSLCIYHFPRPLPGFFVQISDLPTRYVSTRTVPVIPANGRSVSCRSFGSDGVMVRCGVCVRLSQCVEIMVEMHVCTIFMMVLSCITLPETNIAPENRPSQKETSIPTIHFQGLC